MTRFNRYVAAALTATVLTLTAAAPANAIVDEKTGRVVGIIIMEDGTVYH